MKTALSSHVRPIGLTAALLVMFPAMALGQDIAPDSFRELESKYIFGFTFGSDIGPEGERELELTTKVNFQKRTGSYAALEQEAEFEYNPTDSFQIELGAAGVYHAISGVEGFDNFHGVNFGGLSANFRYLLIARGPGSPVGLQISVEPEWSRVDGGGKLVTEFEAQTRIIADTELVPNRLYAAFNLIYTPELEREFGYAKWERASTLGLLGAMTFRIAPKVALGAELEYYRAYDGLGLNEFVGDALYVGPTFHAQITNKIILSAAFSTQIAGHAAGDANFLNLTNFSRNKAMLRAVFEF
ncbi:hypothetical protein [Methylocapsa aurea]|uniref:hypothetical protein n=1 Tax=Methylocapsa aurea TaxID=663610 RepID=UPI0012EC8C05|nr:hypothetical protein [Methylocapsa aurea]